MGGRFHASLALAGTLILAACGEKAHEAPTAPDLSNRPTTGCSFTNISSMTKTEFGANSDEAGYATSMKNAGAGTNDATYYGYLILSAVGGKYQLNTDANNPFSTTNASSLTVELLKCMNIGGETPPDASVFDAALAVTGAYGVRGLLSSEPSLLSHDGTWILEPPGGVSPGNWQAITILTTGITDSRISKAILAYGVPANYTASTFTKDVLKSTSLSAPVFEWATVPHATFDTALGGIVVGECTLESFFMQHKPVNGGAEVLGFVKPSCYNPDGISSAEAAPRNLAERLFRMISPAPAYAALATSTGSGGSKGSLSPFGVVDPGFVNLTFTQSPKFKGNTINQLLTPSPKIADFTSGGSPFLQAAVLTYVQAVANNGVPGQICWNWAYTDETGVATLDSVFITKAGGYQLFAQSVGTATSPDGTEQPVPLVTSPTPVTSTSFNLKNDNSVPDQCPYFNGSYFWNDIVAAPGDSSADFPPTY